MFPITIIALVFAAALCVATTAQAQSQCPGRANVKDGIYFMTADGNIELHKSSSQDMIQVRASFGDGDGSILNLDRGLYLHSSVPIEGSKVQITKRNVFVQAKTLKSWPSPRPNARWNLGAHGRAVSGPASRMRIGNCRYRSYEVSLEFTDGYKETYAYLSDLGIGLLIETVDGGVREKYSFVHVAPAR